MEKFNYCPVIEVGDIFTRKDKNGKVWTAEVVNRTEYFVDVKKIQPYKIKVGDEFGWHYEEAEPTFERCEIYRQYEIVEDGETPADGIWGKYVKKLFKKIPTGRYYINCKEIYSSHYKYDRIYVLTKHRYVVEKSKENCEEN